MVHSSSGLGRRPLTPETRVRVPDALQITNRVKIGGLHGVIYRFFVCVCNKGYFCRCDYYPMKYYGKSMGFILLKVHYRCTFSKFNFFLYLCILLCKK